MSMCGKQVAPALATAEARTAYYKAIGESLATPRSFATVQDYQQDVCNRYHALALHYCTLSIDDKC